MAITNIFGRDFYQGTDAEMATCVPRIDGALFWTTDTLKLYCYSGAAWNEVGGGGGGNVATDAIWDAKGDLAVGTGADTASKLSVGADGKFLKADSGEATGLAWDNVSGDVATDDIWDAKGDIAAGTGANTAAKLTVGADGKMLYADSGEATGLKWDDPPAGTDVATDAIWDAKGDLAVGTGADTASKLTVGADGKYLKADSGEATGLVWDDVAPDAGAITYTPAVDTDWNNDTDPGDVDDALDQLAARVNDVEMDEFVRSSLWVASFFDETDESLHIWYSLDSGGSWTDMGISYGDTVRDPSMMYYRGKWWIAHTHNGAPTDIIPILSSTNIKDWTSIVELDTSAMGGSTYAWAPEWFVDDDDSVHLLIACGGDDKQIYETHPTNAAWTTWSNLVVITGTNLPTDIIDPYLCKIGEMYYLWYKDDTTTYICLATSTSFLTDYTQIESGDWAGFSDDEEGENLVHVSPSLWRIYYNDTLTNGQYYSESTDEFATWTAPAAVSDLSDMSHGSVVQITDLLAVQDWTGSIGCSVSRTNALSIANATPTAITWESEIRDDGGCWDAGNPTRLVAPIAGWYSITAFAWWDADNDGGRRLYIVESGGSTTVGRQSVISGAAHNDPTNCVSAIYYLTAGQYFEVYADQNAGNALNIKIGAMVHMARIK